jgi:superfamily II DNA/RNA helicase
MDVEIVIATPGRLIDFLESGTINLWARDRGWS